MRFSGAVGYAENQQTAPGVWEEVFMERSYRGDVFTNTRRLEELQATQPTLNENVTSSSSISIVADPYAFANFANIRYVVWQGQKWKVPTVTQRRPRLILSIGELWHGNTD